MTTDPRQIDFTTLDPREFEELCFDLRRGVGYLNLAWRQGGADQGRDIEGTFDALNPLLHTVREKWLFQCKHYEAGVGPTPAICVRAPSPSDTPWRVGTSAKFPPPAVV